MATVNIQNTGSDSANMWITLTYSTGRGNLTISKIQAYSTDGYTRERYSDTSQKVNIKVGSETKSFTAKDGAIRFKANNVKTTIFDEGYTWSGSGSTKVTVTLTTSNTYMDGVKFVTNISIPAPADYPTITAPTTDIYVADDNTGRSVAASFSITYNGGYSITESWLKIATDSDMNNVVGTISGTSGTFRNLNNNTTYYVRAYASNGSKYAFRTVSVTTRYAPPTINSYSLSATKDTITVNASITSYTTMNYRLNGGSWQAYSGPITGLAHNTSYTVGITADYNNSPWAAEQTRTITTGGDNPVINSVSISPGKNQCSFSNINTTFDLNANSSVTYTLAYKKQDESVYTTVQFNSGEVVINNLSALTNYDYIITVTDAFSRTGTYTGTFTTLGIVPEITNVTISNLTSNSVSLDFTIYIEPGESLKDLIVSLENSTEQTRTVTVHSNTTITFNNLSPGKEYLMKAKVIDTIDLESGYYVSNIKIPGSGKFNGDMMLEAKINGNIVIGMKFNGTIIM